MVYSTSGTATGNSDVYRYYDIDPMGAFNWPKDLFSGITFTQGMGPWCSKGLCTLEKYWNEFLYCANQYLPPLPPEVTLKAESHRKMMPPSKCLIKKRRKK